MIVEKICWLDLETTGLDPVKNGIHQIAIILEVPDREMIRLNLDVSPYHGDVIDVDALKIAGVTKEEILHYDPPGSAKQMLEDTLSEIIDKFNPADKFILAGWNVKFDADFLRAWWKKANDIYFGSWFRPFYLDVMQIKMFHDFKRGELAQNYKLINAAEELGIQLISAHDAMNDLESTRNIFYKLLNGGFK